MLQYGLDHRFSHLVGVACSRDLYYSLISRLQAAPTASLSHSFFQIDPNDDRVLAIPFRRQLWANVCL